jgi:hypothetical protein
LTQKNDRTGIILTRLRSFLLAAAGVALIAASLAWDVLRGADDFGFGRKQLAGLVVGLLLLAAAYLLHRFAAEPLLTAGWRRLRSQSILRVVISALLSTAATLAALWLSTEQLYGAAAWLFWCYIVSVCLLLPARLGWPLFIGIAVLNAALVAIDTIKTGFTGLPLTMLDIRIALDDPTGLWSALKLPIWTLHASAMGAAFLVLLAIYALSAAARRAWRAGEPRQQIWRAARTGGAVIAVGLLATVFFQRLFHDLGGYDETWDTTGVAAMADEIGVLPYLAYSWRIESIRTGDFFNDSVGAPPPPAESVRQAVLSAIDFSAADSGDGRPNIVILLAESTFDPNAAFRLNGAVTSGLFTPNDRTAAVGPMHVNVVGGGTWVTEFETITGLDSRLFGYSGYYTHSSLAHYVEESLFTYLRARGYRSFAFFPNSGAFYNYRNAYRAYGADRIFDSADQGLPDGWSATDVRLVDNFTRIVGADPEAPFFAYVLLTENHGPHNCRIESIAEAPVRFSGTDAFVPNCALHEYLRRLASTDQAVDSMVQYLDRIRERTGKGFVLLSYGDHQPYTFTGYEWLSVDFGPLRTEARLNQTYFHLISSATGRIRCCLPEIPATLIPTLVSAYVAEGPDDVFLGVNLWLFNRCGPDAIAGEPLTGLFRQEKTGAEHSNRRPSIKRRSPKCLAAYAQALGAYRESGIMTGTPAQQE